MANFRFRAIPDLDLLVSQGLVFPIACSRCVAMDRDSTVSHWSCSSSVPPYCISTSLYALFSRCLFRFVSHSYSRVTHRNMHASRWLPDMETSVALLIENGTKSVQQVMSLPPFDCSHDFSHIRRVVQLAEDLAAAERTAHPEVQLDSLLITLTALLHDIGDHKYALPTTSMPDTAESILLSHSAPPALAASVQTLVSHVSCSYELAHPSAVAAVLAEYPELAIVQDADRLDAIGAIGVGRAFTYGGANARTLAQTRGIFTSKLLMREGMMRTDAGKKIAGERCNRLRQFMSWWDEELGVESSSS